ncbi:MULTISPECIES: phenylacetate--CoA ligase family protein [unclassified Flavobacterium]|uniref:phenylacetate--CoA ligase family protein n=1 Tax=unclassified Flavobacterium TaxID=196869 RepID=UPI0012A7F3F8|nr:MULTISPECIES: phenylacetate--CoA ligase family protein [unclassified Flavobacterium]MBF4483670.1 phenylacetate--CoA ligase family protein [Flavobacterium sp. CSZ]QGK76213.1 phenylacetate--CoA ligase family protein [Flavobacterium sp. SLB02]
MISIFDISLQLNGFPIKEAKAQMDKIVNLSEEEYDFFLANKKEEIVDFHLKNNSFYQELVGNKTDLKWENLPILNKQNLQKPLEERLSKGYSKKNVYLNKTSGSSGTPFVFAKDKYSHALTWASNIMRFGWFGIDFNHSYQARFYGIPMDFIGYQKERFKDFLTHRFRFPVFDLSDAILEKFLQKFKTKKFDYINGYTSSIVLFAKHLEQKNIILNEICPTLKACFVTSEMLFESDKKLLEKQFEIPIINEYGASELDLIAFENPQREWQVNAETLFVEILDENNKVLPYGEEGRIVITSLFNKAHPFIRYEIGDIGILDEKSTLQKPILKKLIGRTNDIAILPSGKKSPGLTFYYVTKSIIEDDGNVKEFIIKQTQLDTFEIEYVSEKELDIIQIQKIEKAIALYLEPNLNFIFTQKTVLERSKSGKLKQFKSYL